MKQTGKFDLSNTKLSPDAMRIGFQKATAQITVKQAQESRQRQDRLKSYASQFDQSLRDSLKSLGVDESKLVAELNQAIKAAGESGKGQQLTDLSKRYGNLLEEARRKAGIQDQLSDLNRTLVLDKNSLLKPLPGGGAAIEEQVITTPKQEYLPTNQKITEFPYIVRLGKPSPERLIYRSGRTDNHLGVLFVGDEETVNVLGCYLDVPAGTRKVTLRAEVFISRVHVFAGAAFGYAAADAQTSFCLTTMDYRLISRASGPQHRLVSAVIGIAELNLYPDNVPFELTYERSDPGKAERLIASVVTRCSAGCGALGGGAGSRIWARLQAITVHYRG